VLPVALLCAAALLAAGSSGSSPRLAVKDARPVTVDGSGFRAHEKLSVRVRAPGVDRTRHPRAAANGAFRTTFTHAVVDRCSTFTVTAIGADGSRATVRRRAQPECPPP
jgi:hypothetical protein